MMMAMEAVIMSGLCQLLCLFSLSLLCKLLLRAAPEQVSHRNKIKLKLELDECVMCWVVIAAPTM